MPVPDGIALAEAAGILLDAAGALAVPEGLVLGALLALGGAEPDALALWLGALAALVALLVADGVTIGADDDIAAGVEDTAGLIDALDGACALLIAGADVITSGVLDDAAGISPSVSAGEQAAAKQAARGNSAAR
jgi:hypothetical protein